MIRFLTVTIVAKERLIVIKHAFPVWHLVVSDRLGCGVDGWWLTSTTCPITTTTWEPIIITKDNSIIIYRTSSLLWKSIDHTPSLSTLSTLLPRERNASLSHNQQQKKAGMPNMAVVNSSRSSRETTNETSPLISLANGDNNDRKGTSNKTTKPWNQQQHSEDQSASSNGGDFRKKPFSSIRDMSHRLSSFIQYHTGEWVVAHFFDVVMVSSHAFIIIIIIIMVFDLSKTTVNVLFWRLFPFSSTIDIEQGRLVCWGPFQFPSMPWPAPPCWVFRHSLHVVASSPPVAR